MSNHPEIELQASDGTVKGSIFINGSDELVFREAENGNQVILQNDGFLDIVKIAPNEANIASELGLPEYDDVSNGPQTQGRLVYATGNGTSSEGIYKHNGSSYSLVGGGLVNGENFDGGGTSDFSNLNSLSTGSINGADISNASLGTVPVSQGNGNLAMDSVGGVDYQEFTSSGTWNKPSGVENVFVEIVGGGAGGDAGFSSNVGGGGGGGGGRVIRNLTPSEYSNSVTVQVGAGGSGGKTESSNPPEQGGNSSFGIITAYGGRVYTYEYKGNVGGAGGNAIHDHDNQTTNYNLYKGGKRGADDAYGDGGDGFYGGGGGGSAPGTDDPAGDGGSSEFAPGGGGGGQSYSSSAGSGGVNRSTPGNEGSGGDGGSGNGVFPGGGGGGANTSGNYGGDGADGVVRVWSW